MRPKLKPLKIAPISRSGIYTITNMVNGKAAEKGYNILPDASSRLGVRHSSETRAKIGKAGLGRECSAEHRAATSKALTGFKRPPFTPEHRAALSAAKRVKRKPRTEEHQAKLTAAHKGRKVSLDTKARMSKAAKDRWVKHRDIYIAARLLRRDREAVHAT